MNEITLLDRYKGAMVGVHIGDAIGAPYEKAFSAKQIARDIEARGELKFFEYPDPWFKPKKKGKSEETNEQNPEEEPEMFPAGRPTDDSDQTADLAFSLIECNGLNSEHLREALRDSVVRGKSRLWEGEAKGAGGTTRKALSDDPVKIAEAMNNNIGTNGSLMRCTPLSLWLYEKLISEQERQERHDEIWTHCARMSHVTHAHLTSKWACVIYTHAMHSILNGAKSPLDALCSIGEIEANKL